MFVFTVKRDFRYTLYSIVHMFLVQERNNCDGCVADCEALSQVGKLIVGFLFALNPTQLPLFGC